MAHRRSSIKRIRVDKRRHEKNVGILSALRTQLRKANALITDKKPVDAKKQIASIFSVLDKAVKKGLLHKNSASRQKSRFTARLNALNSSK